MAKPTSAFPKFEWSPFAIALLLTVVTIVLACVFQPELPAKVPSITVAGETVKVSPERLEELKHEFSIESKSSPKASNRFLEVLTFWRKGFWELLTFSMQMVLILVLGHALALSRVVDRGISRLSTFADTTAKAAFLVAFVAIVCALFNWGLGLIVGALLARKVGEQAVQKGRKINYALIGAAGYMGLMVWHGGLSGSAPLTVTDPKHFLIDEMGVIDVSATIFSSMNIFVMVALAIAVPCFFFFLGKRFTKSDSLSVIETEATKAEETTTEHSVISKSVAVCFSLLLLLTFAYSSWLQKGWEFKSWITLNGINFLLLGLGMLAHGGLNKYLKAINQAVAGASGIILQFPLYAGIMGIMKYGGLAYGASLFFADISNENTLPIFTFISAGIVNVFVPSGGGQWGVQGPVIIGAAKELGVPLAKQVMALSYGDQITNMLQPFWALPLLGITGLKAKQLIPYTLAAMVVGTIIFISALLLF